MKIWDFIGTIVNAYFLRLQIIDCRRRFVCLSLFCLSLFLLVVVFINLLPGMIVKVMHSWTKEALHNLGTSVSFMLTCLEAHITRIVFLTLLCFVIRGILSNFTETRVVSVGLAENAVSWCRQSPIGVILSTIYLPLEVSFYFSLKIVSSRLLISEVVSFMIRLRGFDCSMVQV